MRFLDARLIFPVLLAWVLGTSLQLQQAELFDGVIYWFLAVAGATVLVGLRWKNQGLWVKGLIVSFAAAALAFSTTGLRSLYYLQKALPAALEGQDLAPSRGRMRWYSLGPHLVCPCLGLLEMTPMTTCACFAPKWV